jgi:selenide,water dikinase
VHLHFEFDQIPFISCAQKFADEWAFPGGSIDNKAHFGEHVTFAEHLTEAEQMLLFDAQTSGGLLLCVPEDKLELFKTRAAELNQPVWVVGDVRAGEGISVS